jgi:hypothetical protein
MYTTRSPAHQSRLPKPVSVAQERWYERRSDHSMLPEQFFGTVSLATVCPEAALMCAVLEDAFLCFQKRFETEQRFIQRAREAEDWFFSDDFHWLFAFIPVCDVLGLEPASIRQGLKHWSQSHLDTPQKKRTHAVSRAAALVL